MQQVVLDSNIIIDFTRKASPLLRVLIEKSSKKEIKLLIPAVVVSELIAGQETREKAKKRDLEILFSKFEFIPMNYNLSMITGELLREYRKLDLADATIAATALNLGAKLATRNKKDFEVIGGLKFFKLR